MEKNMDKLPTVGMIYLKDNQTSEEYKKIVSPSWINAGFNLEYQQGITPETFHRSKITLRFGNKQSGRNAGKPFTETEKAIWYSHVKMWEIASRKSNPYIIIEHDVMLLKHIDLADIKKYPILGLCHNGLLSNKPKKGYRISAGGAYMLSRDIAKKMISNLPNKIVTNSDAYIHSYITKYGAFKHECSTQLYIPEIGLTINHDA